MIEMHKPKIKSFTLIEVMVAVVAALTFLVIAAPLILDASDFNDSSAFTVTVNGTLQRTCVRGYTFIVGSDGRAVQILDAEGRGIPCGSAR